MSGTLSATRWLHGLGAGLAIRISQAEIDRVRLRPDAFHGDWNYTILPSP